MSGGVGGVEEGVGVGNLASGGMLLGFLDLEGATMDAGLCCVRCLALASRM